MIEPRPEQVQAMGGCIPCRTSPPAEPPPADGAGTSGAPGPSVVVVDPTKPAWMGIQLDFTSKRPVAGAAWEVTLPNGDVVTGRLDAAGKTRLEGIDPGPCTVVFPELDRRGFE